MESKEIRRLANRFRTRYKLRQIDFKGLKKAVQEQGYTVIEFGTCENDEDISLIIEKLDLGGYIERLRGFTYSDPECRLVFVNRELNEHEKILVLSHEEGHILCGHMDRSQISAGPVEEEEEANQFSHYLLYPNKADRIRAGMEAYKRQIAAGILICIAAAGIFGYHVQAQHGENYYGEFYVTESGERYHKKECIFTKNKNNIRRLTAEDFASGRYKPCQVCLPE